MTDCQSYLRGLRLNKKRRKAPDVRRGELICAARRVFAAKGVANSAVSDIVKEAGVAQGTFYLYFDAKSDLIDAVIEQMAGEMVDSIERSVTAANTEAVAMLLALRDAVLAVMTDPSGWELVETYHRPENRVVHDHMAERFLPRLAPLVERIVRRGLEEGVFTAGSPRVAAWFVLGGLRALELAFTDRAEIANAVIDGTDCALRALGYTGPVRAQAGS
jgi:AcrR family transcriptional regulator